MDFDRILKIAIEINLPKSDIDSISEYLEHGEWGIAFEVLCSAIEYDRIKISDLIFIEIKMIGEYMKMDEDLWKVFET